MGRWQDREERVEFWEVVQVRCKGTKWVVMGGEGREMEWEFRRLGGVNWNKIEEMKRRLVCRSVKAEYRTSTKSSESLFGIVLRRAFISCGAENRLHPWGLNRSSAFNSTISCVTRLFDLWLCFTYSSRCDALTVPLSAPSSIYIARS